MTSTRVSLFPFLSPSTQSKTQVQQWYFLIVPRWLPSPPGVSPFVHVQQSRVHLFFQPRKQNLGLHFDGILNQVLMPEINLLLLDGWDFTRPTSKTGKKSTSLKAVDCEVEELIHEPNVGHCTKTRGMDAKQPKGANVSNTGVLWWGPTVFPWK